jgi:hypothetical protein
MKVQTMVIGLVAFAASLASSAVPSTAHAWVVRFDCHGTSGVPSWAHTSNTLFVEIGYKIGAFTFYDYYNVAAPASKCDQEDEIVVGGETGAASQVKSIWVTSNGDDAFFLDQILIDEDNTFNYKRTGADDQSGWCISTDPADGNNANCPDDAGSWSFSY